VEEILALRDRYVPAERRPMEIEVMLEGRSIGVLKPGRTAQADVPVEMLPGYVKEKPRTVAEEVVTELSGQVQLPRADSNSCWSTAMSWMGC